MQLRITASLLVLTASMCLQANGQETLRWRVQPGENRTYTMQQEAKSTTTAAGAKSTTSTTTSTIVSWDVQKVGDDGAAQVRQSIKHLVMKMNMPGLENVSYDSAAPDAEVNPVLAASIATMKPLLDTPWIFTMNEQGKITEMSGTEKLDTAALEVTQRAKVAALPSNKHTAEQVSAVLPETPVKPGQTWEVNNVVNSPIGQLTTHSTYTFIGTVVTDGRSLKKISLSGDLSLEPFAVAPAKMEMKAGTLNGTILFDNDKGYLVDQQSTVSMTVTINDTTELKTVQELKLSASK